MMQIQFQTSGLRPAVRRLYGMDELARDLRPALTLIADDFLAAEKRRFLHRGDGFWRPLSAYTKARKRREGLDSRVMRATDSLYRSLTQKGATGQVREITSDSLVVGTSLSYAQHHQRRGRKVIVITSGRRKKWAEIVIDHILGEGSA